MRRWIPLLVLATVLSGCDLDMKSSELFLRPDAKNDAMRVLFVHRDITAGDTKKGLKQIQRLLKGERTFMLAYWPFLLDLDEHTKDAEARIAERAKTNQPADESDLLTVSLARRVRVTESGLGTDADGTLVGWQEVVISEWSKFLPDLNRRIALPAESYYRNIVLDRDGCVRLDVRLSKEDKMKALREISKSGNPEDDDGPAVRAILDNMVDVTPIDEGVRLAFGTLHGAATKLRVEAPKVSTASRDEWAKRTEKDRAALQDGLKAAGVALSRVDADAKIRSITGEKAPEGESK